MTYKVEFLTAADYVWAVEVASVNMLVEELKRPDFVNREALYKLVGVGIDDKSAFICKEDGVPVGIIGWLNGENPFNPNIKTASEVLWYVLPEHRKKGAGHLLLKAYSDWAEKGGVMATMSLLSQNDVPPEVLEKFGFSHLETQFIKG